MENHPAFAVLFAGKNVLFSLCKFQPWKSCCVLLGVVRCPGLAEAPMPGQREGELDREAVLEERGSTSIVIAAWIGSKTKVVRVPLYSKIMLDLESKHC